MVLIVNIPPHGDDCLSLSGTVIIPSLRVLPDLVRWTKEAKPISPREPKQGDDYLQVVALPQLAHPPSSHDAGVPSGFFLPQSFISSSFAHLIPLLRISLLFSISVSGNLPSFLKMILKQSPSTHNPTSTSAAKNISIIKSINSVGSGFFRRNLYQIQFLS